MGRKTRLLPRIARSMGLAAVFVLFVEWLRGVAGDQVAYYAAVFILMTVFWCSLYR